MAALTIDEESSTVTVRAKVGAVGRTYLFTFVDAYGAPAPVRASALSLAIDGVAIRDPKVFASGDAFLIGRAPCKTKDGSRAYEIQWHRVDAEQGLIAWVAVVALKAPVN